MKFVQINSFVLSPIKKNVTKRCTSIVVQSDKYYVEKLKQLSLNRNFISN